MKKLLLVMLISITTISMAKEIDLTESKGTDQEVIASITPTPESLTVDENITLKVTFDIALDEKHVKKNDIKLKNISDTHQNIEGTVAYLASENAVTFKADEPLAEGYYEIEFKSLKAIKANKDVHIREIKYRFYVPEVINGHMLPPVPDETKNSATLGGVDINDNGVRDDVERNIYKKYSKKLHSALLMDKAKIYQRTLVESTSNALIIQKEITRTLNCRFYLMDFDKDIEKTDWRIRRNTNVKDTTFNNLERVEKYLKYNLALSGGSYGSSLEDENIEACSPDVVNVLEEMK